MAHAVKANRELPVQIVKPVGQFYHAPIRKLDQLVFEVHEQGVISDEEFFRIQRNLLSGVEQESYVVIPKDVDDEEGGFLVWKIDLLNHVSPHLADKISVSVVPDGLVKISDDLLMFEFPVLVVPPAIAIHPENGILF